MLLSSYHSHNNTPLIFIKGIPLTERKVHGRLEVILKKMGLRKCGFSFHAFRGMGATLAFGEEVPLQAIRAHGAWAPDALIR